MPTDGPANGHVPRVTMQQIAEEAGVSMTTVSRVLNGRSDVADVTRDTVLRVMRERGYGARRAARPRPRPEGTRFVGVTMPFTDPAYFATILGGAAEALYELGLQAVICPTHHERARELSLVEQLTRGEIEGALLILPEESNAELRQLTERDFPFVVVDPSHDVDESIAVVSAAHASGANQATRHLVELGHRRIAVVTGPHQGTATRERRHGYHAALAAAGIVPDPALEVESDFRRSGGRAAAGRLFSSATPPTAVFCFNDNLAIGAMQAARAAGLDVPGDVSIVGFDDTRDASIAFPALTTVRQPLAELGRMAVSLLERLRQRQPFEARHVELATKLIVRDSTGPPRP